MKKLLLLTSFLVCFGSFGFAQVSQDCSVAGSVCSQNNASVDLSKETNNSNANISNDLSDAYNNNSFDMSGSSQNNENHAVGQGGTASATGGNSTGNVSDNKSSASIGGNLQSNTGANNTNSQTNGGNNATQTLGGSNNQGDITGGSANTTGGTASTNSGNIETKGGDSSISDNKLSGGKASQSSSQSQRTKQSQSASNSGVQNNTQVDARNQSEYNEAASTAFAAGIYGQSTAPCVKVSGIGVGAQTVGAGWTLNLRNDRESGNCITNQRVGMIQSLYGNDGAALYLAQQDPAAAAVIETLGLPSGRKVSITEKGKKKNYLGQSTMAQPSIQQQTEICKIKGDGSKTVITNWNDKHACARTLGLLK